jgi:hypothetical protein
MAMRKLRYAPLRVPAMPRFTKLCTLLGLTGAMAIAALWSADAALTFDAAALRHFARTAGIGALQGLAAALVLFSLLYALLFQRKIQR